MPIALSRTARIITAAIALSVFGSIALQVHVNLTPNATVIGTLGQMLRFFTIWTNLAIGLVMAWAAWKSTANAHIAFALTTAIVIVAVVYHLLLAGDHHPEGLDWWTNLMFHTLIPAAFVLWWLIWSHHDGVRWQSLPVIMIWPIAYSAFALVHGAMTGFYAYFFLDPSTLGWPMLIVSMLGLSVLFMLSGAALLAVRGVITKRLGR